MMPGISPLLLILVVSSCSDQQVWLCIMRGGNGGGGAQDGRQDDWRLSRSVKNGLVGKRLLTKIVCVVERVRKAAARSFVAGVRRKWSNLRGCRGSSASS